SPKTDPVTLRFSGNFEFAATKGFQPNMRVNGTEYPASANTTQELRFDIPLAKLFTNVEHKYNAGAAELVVHWETTTFFGIFHHRHIVQYKVIVGALPQSHGKPTLSHTVSESHSVTRRFRSQGYHQASTREAGNDDHKNVPYSVTPDPGWHVVRNTS